MPPTVIESASGTVRVESFTDTTPGDEYAAVSLEVAGVQVDLSIEQAEELALGLRAHGGYLSTTPR
ncbi:hypothetical protein [Corynebacterium striatum]|nr:hypothetical protein U2A4042170038 [Corynebacterium striatum]